MDSSRSGVYFFLNLTIICLKRLFPNKVLDLMLFVPINTFSKNNGEDLGGPLADNPGFEPQLCHLLAV